MRTEPYEKILRDIRIFPIFEGANDVMRAFVALSGMKPVGERLSELGEIGLHDPIGSIGVLVDYVGARIRKPGARPTGSRSPTPSSRRTRDDVSDQVERASGGKRVAAARAQARDRRAPVPAEAARRRGLRHLRPGRGALAGERDARRPGRRALGSGALHRRHLLRPRRRPRALEPAPGRGQRRRADDRDRQARLQAAASTATRCSRTEAARAYQTVARGSNSRSRRSRVTSAAPRSRAVA